EWQSGIARLAAADLSAEAQSLVAPYLKIAAPLLTAEPVLYPGSPSIAKSLMRENDRLLLCELHPAAFAALRDNLGREPRAKLIEIDGYRGLKAFVPPIERRGLVLIDPPFEAADEFETLFEAIEMAWRKWATGIYMIWYPVKDRARVANFMRALRQSSIKRVLRLELQVADVTPEGPLTRCGVIVINPPFPLEAEARILLPSLASCLSLGQNGGIMLEWLAGESGANGLSI
ncbi:MAG TPA: 23S rRNA (adenine(2030)-N(6))-methyltransferase RlmJ, partial [Beijerinckia sp.]|nr:23S rRNA (adenine(2030)-N(6))-methyltransferase RlmJ [Beijerinckia sp.]